jgi:hypothetical protein
MRMSVKEWKNNKNLHYKKGFSEIFGKAFFDFFLKNTHL